MGWDVTIGTAVPAAYSLLLISQIAVGVCAPPQHLIRLMLVHIHIVIVISQYKRACHNYILVLVWNGARCGRVDTHGQ